MEQYKSFFRNQAVSIAAFVIAALLIAGCLLDFNRQVRLNLLRDTRAQAEAIGVNAVRLLENEVGYLKRLTNTASMLMGEQDAQDDAWIVDELQRYAERGSIVRALFETLDGRTYTSYSGYLGQSDQNPMINGISLSDIKEPVVVSPFYAEDLKKVIFGVAAPATLGGRQGVLVSSYDVEQFERLFENKFSGGEVQIGIVRRDGSVILGRTHHGRQTAFGTNIFKSYTDGGTAFSAGSVEEMQNDLAEGSAGYASYSFDGEERYLSYLPTEIDDWYVAVLVPERALRPQASAIRNSGVQLTVKLTTVMACLMAVVFIIRRREERNTRNILQKAAMLDGLTHLYNRATAEQQLTALFEKADVSCTHALFVIDVDAFKQINDAYGHLMGDEVLIGFAQRLRALFGDDALLGRMGGDEFIALFQNCGGREDAQRRAEEICMPFFTRGGNQAPPVSVSVGAALYPDNGTSFHTLYLKADKALYAAKGKGKNGFAFYSPEQE